MFTDIVVLVNMILNPELPRGKPATKVAISYGNRVISYESDGNIAGLQFSVNGIFEITENYLPAGWELDYNENTILLYSLDGSALENNLLFEYDGELIIEESIVADWYGSDISVQTVTLPKEFSLERAYPNPFNPVTTIQYGLPVDAAVNIIIYDLQGRIAAELTNEFKSAGYYTLKWDASDQASGIYFVKMMTAELTKTQKLMLVK